MAGPTQLSRMLTGFFRQDRPTTFLPLPFLVLLLWPGAGTGPGAFLPDAAMSGQTVPGMPLFQALRQLADLSPWVSLLLSLIVVLGLADALNRLANDAELHERRNRMAAPLLILLLALQPYGLFCDPALVGMWVVAWAFTRIWTAIGRPNILGTLFDAGLLLGIAALFYLPYAFLTVALWATLAVTRPFKFREYVLPAIGLATILLLGWGVVHFIRPGLWAPVASMHFPVDLASPAEAHWMYQVILLAVLAALALATMASFASVYGHSVMREKNIRASFLAFVFACGLLALFAWWLDGRVPPVLMAAPGAILLAFPLLRAKRRAWADAALWGLILLAGWARWAG